MSLPIANLATPLFGMAFMVHMHKRLSGPRHELIAPSQRRENVGALTGVVAERIRS